MAAADKPTPEQICARLRAKVTHETGASGPQQPPRSLGAGDHVTVTWPGFARAHLLCEQRAGHLVLRIWTLNLFAGVPRAQGFGSVFHQAVELWTRKKAGLHFATADHATLERDNAPSDVLRAMRDAAVGRADHDLDGGDGVRVLIVD